MLQSIREKTQGWIAGTIITILILAFALWGIHSYFTGSGVNQTAAEVNGTPITLQQLNSTYEQLRRQIQAEHPQQALALLDNNNLLKEQALQSLVNQEVLLQRAKSEKFFVSDNQVDSYLETMPEFQEKEQFSVARMQQLLANAGLSTANFLIMLKNNLLIQQPKLGILLSAFALPQEVSQAVNLVNQQRDVGYIDIPFTAFSQQVTAIDAKAIENYYQNNQALFMSKAKVSIDYLLLTQSELAKNIQPSTTELNEFYTANLNEFSTQAEWKLYIFEMPLDTHAANADALITALQNGISPKQTANEYNAKLENTNWQKLIDIAAPLQPAVKELTQRGQISKVINTADGRFVVQVADYKDAKVIPFQDALPQVKTAYIQQKARESLLDAKEQLADLTYEDPESLQSAAKKLHLTSQTSPLFTQYEGVDEITRNPQVRAAAFSDDVLKNHNNSDVITLAADKYLVLRVKDFQDARLQTLAEVKPQIEATLKAAEVHKLAQQTAENIMVELQSGSNLNEVLAKHHLTQQNLGFIGRDAGKLEPEILNVAFALPNPQASHHPASYGLASVPGGFAIVSVTGIKAGSITDAERNKVFTDQVVMGDGMLEYELYKQYALEQAKVKVY